MEPVHVHYADGGHAEETPDETLSVGEYLDEFCASRGLTGEHVARLVNGPTVDPDDPVSVLGGQRVALNPLVHATAHAAADADAGLYPLDGTVDAILDWVGDDDDRAGEALEAELAGRNRKGIVDPLTDLLNTTLDRGGVQ